MADKRFREMAQCSKCGNFFWALYVSCQHFSLFPNGFPQPTRVKFRRNQSNG